MSRPSAAGQDVFGDLEVTLGSSRKYLTTFFSDIRGFTELSERMGPEELVGELYEYLSEMTEIVFEHGGTLDKHIGDAVMVFFGDPVQQDDHADRARAGEILLTDRTLRESNTALSATLIDEGRTQRREPTNQDLPA